MAKLVSWTKDKPNHCLLGDLGNNFTVGDTNSSYSYYCMHLSVAYMQGYMSPLKISSTYKAQAKLNFH